MKTLFLIRHAKSSWDNSTLPDFDRPLNDRGKKDAPLMGKWLCEKNEIPDAIFSSEAKRARKTAVKIARETGYDENKIIFHPGLYHAQPDTWLKITCNISNAFHTVFMVGHNNGITHFANYLTRAGIASIPTCGIVKIFFKFSGWEEISEGTGQLVYFQYPKTIVAN